MTGCSGPYTRVFFEGVDAPRCADFAETFEESFGLEVERALLPKGDGTLKDVDFDIFFHDPKDPDTHWVLHLAKFLGPKRLMRHTNVYEATLERVTDDWRGHLYASKLDDIIDAVRDAWPHLAAGEAVPEMVPHGEAHATLVKLCNG